MSAIGLNDRNVLTMVSVAAKLLSGAIAAMTAAYSGSFTGTSTAVSAAYAYGILMAGYTIAADVYEGQSHIYLEYVGEELYSDYVNCLRESR